MASRFLAPFGGRGLMGRGDPFLDLHREVNRLFDDSFRGMGGGERGEGGRFMLAPRVDIHERDDRIEVCAELPGVSEKDIDLSVDGDMLTIRGEKRNERQDAQAHVIERSYGSFQRSIQLPFAPDPDKVEASCANGVLTVSIPNEAQRERRRRIEVRGGQGLQPGSTGKPAIGGDWQSSEQDSEREKQER